VNLTQLAALHRAKVIKAWASAEEKRASAEVTALEQKLIDQMADDGQSSGKWDMPHEDEVIAAFLAPIFADAESRIHKSGARVERRTFAIHGQLWAGPKEDMKDQLMEALRAAGREELLTLNYQSLSAEVRELCVETGVDQHADEIDISEVAPGWGQYTNVSRKTTLHMTKG